jgi:hypothetical protein
MGETRNTYRMLLGKPEKCQLGNPRSNWEDTTETDLEDQKWMELVLDSVQWWVLVFNLRVLLR